MAKKRSESPKVSYRRRKRNTIYHNIVKAKHLVNLSKFGISHVKNVAESINVPCSFERIELSPAKVTDIRRMQEEMRETVENDKISFHLKNSIANEIIDDLDSILRRCGYIHEFHIYGSYLTGLCCLDSDVDLFFEFEGHTSGTTPNDIPSSVCKILKKDANFTKIIYIEETKVPFIKFLHKNTGKWVNITFADKMGIQNSLLIKLYLTMNPYLKTLTLYLKRLLKQYNLKGIGKITTHTLFWMVVFFMQKKNLLPLVCEVRRNADTICIINNKNCSVPDSYDYPSNHTICLFSLLLDFVTFYRDFDFSKYVMCPLTGKAVPIDEVDSQLSPEFVLKFINLQHPSNSDYNLGHQVGRITVNKFKILCCFLSRSLPYYLNHVTDDFKIKDILPEELPYKLNQPDVLKQYVSFSLNVSKIFREHTKQLSEHVFDAVRQLMENVFDFEPMKAVEQTVPRVTNPQVHTLYLNYTSTTETWDNSYIQGIFPPPRRDKCGEPYRELNVNVICEFYENEKNIRVVMECDAHFALFLEEYANPLLKYVLKEMVDNYVLC